VIWGTPVTLVNGRVACAPDRPLASSIRFASKVLAIDEPPRRGDTVVDLEGRFVIPGLVNAHDHLELNHYGRLKFRDRYGNATEWIDDMRPRLESDPAIAAARRHPLGDRLFIGALKNLLAGVTTVAHHNPYYAELRRTMPIRVVQRYGWAHSFALENRPAGARGERGGDVAKRWRQTPADAPFFVHLAEGVDDEAAGELARLESCGCLAANTVVVHGVALDASDVAKIIAAGAALVWCPASNGFLFGRTAPVRLLLGSSPRSGRVALGSDSRLTGSTDLLAEMRAARATGCATDAEIVAMVTTDAAAMLRLAHAGTLAIGAPADLAILPAAAGDMAGAVIEAQRRDLTLVAVDGRPLVGDRSMAAAFRARNVATRDIVVDDAPKIAASPLARRIRESPIPEPGVSVAA